MDGVCIRVGAEQTDLNFCEINVKFLVSFKNLNTPAMPVKPKEKSFVSDTKECKQSSRD